MDERAAAHPLVLGVVGAIVLSTVVVVGLSIDWRKESPPTGPMLVVTHERHPDGEVLDLDVASTRIDSRRLATALDTAYAGGRSMTPMTEAELAAATAYLSEQAARQGSATAPTLVSWRGQTFHITSR